MFVHRFDLLSKAFIGGTRLLSQLLDALFQALIELAELHDLYAQLINLPLRIPPQLTVFVTILAALFSEASSDVLNPLKPLFNCHRGCLQLSFHSMQQIGAA